MITSQYFNISGTASVFASNRHIASKQHCSVWTKSIANVWSQVQYDNYDLVNNSIVLNTPILSTLAIQAELRVADSQEELGTSPTNISILAGLNTEIELLASKSNELSSIYDNIDGLIDISDNIVKAGIVADNIANVNTVADNIDDIVIVKDNTTNINIVASDIANVNTVAIIDNDITTLANIDAEIVSLYGDRVKLSSLYSDKLTLDSLYADKATLDGLFSSKTAIDGLFTIKAKLDSLYADKVKLDSIYADKTKLDSLYADKTALDTLYSNITAITTLYTNISNIVTVANNIANVNTTATNIVNVNSFANTYKISSTAPSTPTEGMLWYDTVNNVVKYHNGSVWVAVTPDLTADIMVATKKVDMLYSLRTITEAYETVWVSGYHTKNDGAFGSHIFRLKGVKTTETDNGGTVIIATIGGVDYVYELQYDGAVNVKWFGAKGDGSIETAILNYALQTSKAIGATEIDFGSGRYETDAELIIPDNIIVNLNKCTIHANHLSGNILKTIHNATEKPAITLIGNRAKIEGPGFAGTDSLVGLWIDTCNFSRFSGLVFTNFNGNSVILGATGQRDIISFVIDNIETNTGSGLKMLTGYIGGVQYSNITTGSVRDCFWTCIGAGNVGFEATAALKQDLSESSLYGINFERCSFNPTNPNYGTMISMSAISPGVIREITFYGCEGETRTTTPVSPLVYLHRVVNSKFNLTGYLLNSEGIRLVDCHNNIFDNLTFPMTNPSDTSTFISIDVNSTDNIFNNYNLLGNQISTAYGFNAPLSGYVWDNIIDYGKNTIFNGQITNRIRRVFDESYLDLLTSGGKSIYPSIPDTGTTWSKVSGLYYGSATTATMLEFNVPTYIPIGTLVTFRIKYRFTSDISAEPANWRFGISVDGTLQGPRIPMNTTWTDYIVSAVITGRKTRIYTSSYTQPVTMQFEKIEIFIGGYPYIPNYTPVDDKNIFLNNPYCTTASRPYYGKEIGFSIFDTTLNKQITWNGTVWKDGSGTTV